MAMTITAFDPGFTAYLLRVHLDTTKTIRDPSQPAPATGQPDNRPLVPDPAWVVEYEWGKVLPAGQDTTTYLANCKREALLLAQGELKQRVPPTEISLPI